MAVVRIIHCAALSAKLFVMRLIIRWWRRSTLVPMVRPNLCVTRTYSLRNLLVAVVQSLRISLSKYRFQDSKGSYTIPFFKIHRTKQCRMAFLQPQFHAVHRRYRIHPIVVLPVPYPVRRTKLWDGSTKVTFTLMDLLILVGWLVIWTPEFLVTNEQSTKYMNRHLNTLLGKSCTT